MNRLKAWIRMFFGFSRMETNAFLILIPLMFFILFSEPAYRYFRPHHPPDFFSESKKLDSLIATLEWNKPDTLKIRTTTKIETKFYSFDPNLVSEDEFIKLGLPKFLASRIVRFREKGGKFTKPPDMLKIYGMDSIWFKKAVSWITIIPEKKQVTTIPSFPTKKAEEKIDINLADSLQLMAVYGVGSKLSKRILTFRNKLGGFVSMKQLSDVYGLDSTVVQQLNKKFFIQENFQPLKKINLNTAAKEDLLGNPYIRYKEAQAILIYRLQHGNFISIENLKEIQMLTPDWVEKVKPYLTLE